MTGSSETSYSSERGSPGVALPVPDEGGELEALDAPGAEFSEAFTGRTALGLGGLDEPPLGRAFWNSVISTGISSFGGEERIVNQSAPKRIA